MSKSSISKRKDNTKDEPFGLIFFEWFPASPRWYDEREMDDVVRYLPPIDHEPEVKDKVFRSYRNAYDDHPFILTCMSPTCPNREQAGWTAAQFSSNDMLRSRLTREAAKVGWIHSELQTACKTCGSPCFVYAGRIVREAWIYVFRESGGALIPYCEINTSEPDGSGDIRYRYDKGAHRFHDDARKSYPGYLQLSSLTEHTWHFFLSRVRLSGRSMKEVCMLPRASKRRGGLPSYQPWAVTVKREFTEKQIEANVNGLTYEIIPLADPFEWVETAILVDAFPMLDARDELRTNASEQSKLYLASVLSVLMTPRRAKEGVIQTALEYYSPGFRYEYDKFNLSEELVPPPGKYSTSSNVAEAWVKRFQDNDEFLARETEKAFGRVFDVVRNAPGHRIVEMACQDGATGDHAPFIYGLAHWAHILEFSLVTNEGGKFLEWLDQNPDAADTIPIKNLKKRADVDWPSLTQNDEISEMVDFILSFLLPRIISNSSSPDEAALTVAGIINALHPDSAQASRSKIAKFFKEGTKAGKKGLPKIGNTAIEAYWKRYYQKDSSGSLKDLKERLNLKKRIELLTRGGEFIIDLCTLWITFQEFQKARGKERMADEDWWVTLDQMKKIGEPFQKTPDFVMKQIRNWIKGSVGKKAPTVGKLLSTLDEQGLKGLTKIELEHITSLRVLRSYTILWKAGKVFTGWGGLLFGGLSLITDTGKAVNAWEAGDPGATLGMGLIAASNVGFMIAAGADIYLLHVGVAGGAAAGGGAGGAAGGAAGLGAVPIVGLVSLAVLGLGIAIYTFCSKNELQKLAQHCWMGKKYGVGDWKDETEMFWMGKEPWPWLRYNRLGEEDPERFIRQAMALRRLTSRYSVEIKPLVDFCSGRIIVASLPELAMFEVEIEVTPEIEGRPIEDRKRTFRVLIWPIAKDYTWEENDDFQYAEKYWVKFLKNYPGENLNAIEVKAVPVDTLYGNYVMRVRLNIGGGKYVPFSEKYISVSSSDVFLGQSALVDSTDYT